MQLIKEKDKVYILLSNVEEITEDYCSYNYCGGHLFHLIKKGRPIRFQGSKGAFLFRVDEIHHVSRVLPYDTTARHYWGEFRRSYKMIPRLSDMVHLDEDYLLECSFLENLSQEDFDDGMRDSYEFNSFAPCEAKREYRNKTWNLTNDRPLGPNLSDYSTNDCYKYYTLL